MHLETMKKIIVKPHTSFLRLLLLTQQLNFSSFPLNPFLISLLGFFFFSLLDSLINVNKQTVCNLTLLLKLSPLSSFSYSSSAPSSSSRTLPTPQLCSPSPQAPHFLLSVLLPSLHFPPRYSSWPSAASS